MWLSSPVQTDQCELPDKIIWPSCLPYLVMSMEELELAGMGRTDFAPGFIIIILQLEGFHY